MKNKGLIIGGVAIVALGAFWWMRKKNAMASEGIDDAKSDTSTGGGTTGKDDSKLTSKPPRQRTDGASVKGSGATASPTPMTLTSKPINGVQDLDGTPLGLDISSAIINNDARLRVQSAIVNMNGGERQVLNYIAVVDYPTRTSQSFKDALSSLLGANASSLADSIYNKLLNASRFVSNASQSQSTQRKECRQYAKDICGRGWGRGKISCRWDKRKQCKDEGGYEDPNVDLDNFLGASGFEIDKEDYGFNGDNIL